MDTRLLRTFVAVAEHGSFSGAAEQLGYTQSAVSQQIATLEADLGAAVLSRRPVGLTEAGARLLEHARPLLLRLDAARAEVVRAAGPPPAVLLIGAAPLTAPRAAAALAAVLAARPRLEATLRVAARDEIAKQAAAGALDLALVDGVAAPGDPLRLPDSGVLSATAVAQTRLMVVLPGGHPLAGRAALRLGDLAEARWIDAPGAGIPLADLRAAAGSESFRPSLRYDGADVATLIALAAAGQGLAVLPEPAPRGDTGATGVPLGSPTLVHRVELVHGALTPASADFAASLTGGTISETGWPGNGQPPPDSGDRRPAVPGRPRRRA